MFTVMHSSPAGHSPLHTGFVSPHGDDEEMQMQVERSWVLHTASGGHVPGHCPVKEPQLRTVVVVVELVEVVVVVGHGTSHLSARQSRLGSVQSASDEHGCPCRNRSR